MHPYVQDQRVTARRMRDLMTRSERIRLAHATKEQALLLEPIAMRDPGELVHVVRLQAAEPARPAGCGDERIAS